MASDKPTAVITMPRRCIHIRGKPDDELVLCGRLASNPVAIRLECELDKLAVLVEPEAPIIAFCPNCLSRYLARLTDRNAELEARIEGLETWTGAADPDTGWRFVKRIAKTIRELVAEEELF